MQGLPFRPLPFLGNPHLQTILGTYLPGPILTHRSVEHQLQLPDGDRLVLHDSVPAQWRLGQPIALLVHGLGGTHRSGYLQRLARLLLRWHWRVVRIDLRGCGKGIALAHQPYHAGCSEDIRACLAFVQSQEKPSPLVAIGFSLGGNIVLKLAGEARARPVPGLTRVVAVNPPIDLLRSSTELGQPRNRFYERHFVRGLVALARQRARHFSDHRMQFPSQLSLRRFDDIYVAPRCGFADAEDYYTRSSSLPLIGQIDVPTLILTARDDPLVPVDMFQELKEMPCLEVQIASGGGHLGYLGWDGNGGIRWADQRILEWLKADLRVR